MLAKLSKASKDEPKSPDAEVKAEEKPKAEEKTKAQPQWQTVSCRRLTPQSLAQVSGGVYRTFRDSGISLVDGSSPPQLMLVLLLKRVGILSHPSRKHEVESLLKVEGLCANKLKPHCSYHSCLRVTNRVERPET